MPRVLPPPLPTRPRVVPVQIERIRTLSECAQQLAAAHDRDAGRYLAQKMAEELFSLPLEEALPILRAYGHYLK